MTREREAVGRSKGYVVRVSESSVTVENHRRGIFMPFAQFLRCDREELLFARRTIFGTWSRAHFDAKEVKAMQRVLRMHGRSATPVLTFLYRGRTVDILEMITFTDAERLLKASQRFGLDVLASTDEAATMMRDIDLRGWFTKPWSR